MPLDEGALHDVLRLFDRADLARSTVIGRRASEFFDSYQGPMHVEFPDIQVSACGDVAFRYCLHRVKGTLKTGQLTDWWLRWTACYRRSNGRWLIAHEQVSVPVDFRTGRAMLDLQP